MIILPSDILYAEREGEHDVCRPRAQYSLDAVLHHPEPVDERLSDGNDVVLLSDAHRTWHRRVHAKRLPHDRVQVRERVQLVHRRVVRRDGEELLAEPLLDVRGLRKCEETPGGRVGRRLVASDQEPA